MEGKIVFEIHFRNQELALASAFALGDSLTANNDVVDWSVSYKSVPDSNYVTLHGNIHVESDIDDVCADIGSTCVLTDGFISGSINAAAAEAL
jgi:hypothetical protein